MRFARCSCESPSSGWCVRHDTRLARETIENHMTRDDDDDGDDERGHDARERRSRVQRRDDGGERLCDDDDDNDGERESRRGWPQGERRDEDASSSVVGRARTAPRLAAEARDVVQ